MLLLRIALLAVVVLAPVACYGPNIKNGGLECSATGKACPDGFECAYNNHCYSHDAPVCPNQVAALCSAQPANGALCNPACQTGCGCGRCTIDANGTAVCTQIVGTKTLGQVCDLTNDDCAPGFGCLKDVGCNIGRCARFCASQGDCDTGSHCNAFGQATLCDPIVTKCNPLKPTDGECPSAVLACYPVGNTTTCQCTGTQAVGYSCSGSFNDPKLVCAPGGACINMPNLPDGGAGSFCYALCDTTKTTMGGSNSDCTSSPNLVCHDQGFVSGVGYCFQ